MNNQGIADSIYHSLIIIGEERNENKSILDGCDSNSNIFVYILAFLVLLMIILIFIYLAYVYFRDW